MTIFPQHKTAETWRLEGNTRCKEGKYVQAIAWYGISSLPKYSADSLHSYDQALRLTGTQDDAIVLLLNRCHARNASHHFDAALADADAILNLSSSNEKALFRAARALYGLRRYEESKARLLRLTELYPNNQDAVKDTKRCKNRLLEQSGIYDFGDMLDEAIQKSPAPDMDRAAYDGSVEVRQCVIKSHGRGLFTTRPVQAGDLLLVEKAFSVAFPEDDGQDAPYDAFTGVRSNKSLKELHAELASSTFIRLHKNPSVMKEFAKLFPGPDAKEEIDPNLGHAFIDE